MAALRAQAAEFLGYSRELAALDLAAEPAPPYEHGERMPSGSETPTGSALASEYWFRYATTDLCSSLYPSQS